MVGADQGGAEADYRSLLGKVVHWTATEVRTPGRTCQLQDAKIAEVPNSTLAFDWGGETIDDLSLSRGDKAKAFGTSSTPVLGTATCGNGVLIDKDRLLMMLDNGFIYVLNRTTS